MSRCAAACLALAALLVWGSPAAAHGRSTSTSAWEIGADGAHIRVQVAWADLQRALPELAGREARILASRPDLAARIDVYLLEHYRLTTHGRPCQAEAPRPAPTADATHVARRWSVACVETGPRVVHADGFTEAVPAHLHLARLRVGDAPPFERVFVLASPSLVLDGEAPAGLPSSDSFAEFVRLGVEHIATGWDHLVFLLALLLVGVSVYEVATVVTGFTVAHSLTLALGVLGVVQPQAAAVEALIGLSIAVVALENVSLSVGPSARLAIFVALALLLVAATIGAAASWLALPTAALAGITVFSLCYFALLPRVARPFRLRWLLAFVFGLVHGFGFAGILAEMELPQARLVPALLGFNVGVELGQLVLVAAAWPLLRIALSGAATRRLLVVHAGSAAVLAAGLFWFATRAFAS